MRHKSGPRGTASEKAIKDIRRATRKRYSAEEKIRIVLDGLRGEETIAELCRRDGRDLDRTPLHERHQPGVAGIAQLFGASDDRHGANHEE
jgi:hypothetical protein